MINYFPKDKILDSSKLKEFADDNFKFDKNGREFSEREKTQWDKEKLLVMSNISLCHRVFRRNVAQTSKNKGLFGRRLKSVSMIKTYLKLVILNIIIR